MFIPDSRRLQKKTIKLNCLNIKKIVKCYLIGKNIKFFKDQIKDEITFCYQKLKRFNQKIFKVIKLQNNHHNNIL